MCVLRGNDYEEPDDVLLPDLADAIFYMDFSGIFDSGVTPKIMERQRKAEAMFRPEGVCLDFGTGEHCYLAFERSGSMSRQARLSFIRADLYVTVLRRIMMDLEMGDCQLSKLYAYNGLMLSSGVRVDGVDIDRPHRVIVIDNPNIIEGLNRQFRQITKNKPYQPTAARDRPYRCRWNFYPNRAAPSKTNQVLQVGSPHLGDLLVGRGLLSG